MRLRFILSETGKGLSRNKAMAVAVIIVTYISLLFVGVAALAQIQVNMLRTDWYDKIEVSIYMCAADDRAPSCDLQEATEEQIDEAEDSHGSAHSGLLFRGEFCGGALQHGEEMHDHNE